MTTVESISQPESELPQEEIGRGPSEPLLSTVKIAGMTGDTSAA